MDYSHKEKGAAEEREDRLGPAGSPCTLRGFSGDRKMLLSGPGVLNMGSPASFSGTARPQEKGHSRPRHSGTGQTSVQCRHREGLLEKAATSDNVQVLSGKTLSPPGPSPHRPSAVHSPQSPLVNLTGATSSCFHYISS